MGLLSALRKYRQVLRIVALVLILVALFANCRKVIKDPFKGDLGAYLHGSRELLAGENIYAKPSGGDELTYIYPPLLAVLLIPFALLPIDLAAVIWYLFNIFLVAYVVKVACELITGASFWRLPAKVKWALGLFPVLLTLRFLLIHLYRGQVNILEMALVMLSLKIIINQSRKKSFLAGGVIGASIVIKLVSSPIVILFLLERKLRIVAGVVIGIVISLMIPGLIIGHAENLSYLSQWFQSYLLDSTVRDSKLGLGYNISPYAQLLRFFSSAVAFKHDGHPYYLTIFQTSSRTILIADWLIRFAVVGSILFYWFRNRNNKRILWGGGIALTFALIPFFFPTTQNSYLVFLLPSYVFVVYVWCYLRLQDIYFRSLVIGSFILTSMTGQDVCGKLLEDVFTASGCMLWGTLLLILAIFRATNILRVQGDQILPANRAEDQLSGSAHLRFARGAAQASNAEKLP